MKQRRYTPSRCTGAVVGSALLRHDAHVARLHGADPMSPAQGMVPRGRRLLVEAEPDVLAFAGNCTMSGSTLADT